MKILVAGATGALGRRLVPLLTAAGHEVAGLTRSPAKVGLLRSIGTEPIVADALDPSAVMNAVRQRKPEIVVHELTSIKKVDLRNFDRGFAATNRLRMEDTDHLLAAARAAGVRRFIAQSFAGKPDVREGGWVKTEEDPLDPNPPPSYRRTLEAIRYLESKRGGVLGRPSASVQPTLDLNRGRIACHGLAGRSKPMAQLGSNVAAIGSNSL